jgi:hypothetical protein
VTRCKISEYQKVLYLSDIPARLQGDDDALCMSLTFSHSPRWYMRKPFVSSVISKLNYVNKKATWSAEEEAFYLPLQRKETLHKGNVSSKTCRN